jgi:hypothetical protein
MPGILEITPVKTLTGRRLSGPSGFLPPSQRQSWREQSKPPAPRNRKAAMLSMTRQEAYEISIHARRPASGNRKDRPGFAGDTLQEQDTLFHAISLNPTRDRMSR